MKSRQSGLTQDTSAAKADISTRSGRRIENNPQPSKKQWHWKTRKDPFSSVWEPDALDNARLGAVTFVSGPAAHRRQLSEQSPGYEPVPDRR